MRHGRSPDSGPRHNLPARPYPKPLPPSLCGGKPVDGADFPFIRVSSGNSGLVLAWSRMENVDLSLGLARAVYEHPPAPNELSSDTKPGVCFMFHGNCF